MHNQPLSANQGIRTNRLPEAEILSNMRRKRFIIFVLNLILNTPNTEWSIKVKGKVKQGR